MPCLSQRLAARRQTLREKREQERRVAELLQERGQSMAEQVACVDSLLRQDPVRANAQSQIDAVNSFTGMGRAVAAAQAPLGEVEELTSTEASTQTHQESRRAAWQESDDDGDGKDEAEHEESEERQESKGSEENAVGELMPSGASAEEEPEDDSEAELDPDAIVRQYLQHEAGADADGLEGREKTGEP